MDYDFDYSGLIPEKLKVQVGHDIKPIMDKDQIVVKGQGYVIATAQGNVVLQLVKPAGKGWMDGAAFMAGRRLAVGDILGK